MGVILVQIWCKSFAIRPIYFSFFYDTIQLTDKLQFDRCQGLCVSLSVQLCLLVQSFESAKKKIQITDKIQFLNLNNITQGGNRMILYSIIMFVTGILFCGISLAIYRGKTNLIHDYHQTKVTDKAAYGKAFGKAMLVISLSLLSSGIVGLFGDTKTVSMIAVTVLFVGMLIGLVCIVLVQKKYNNGIF